MGKIQKELEAGHDIAAERQTTPEQSSGAPTRTVQPLLTSITRNLNANEFYQHVAAHCVSVLLWRPGIKTTKPSFHIQTAYS